jgi:hypothetical protein
MSTVVFNRMARFLGLGIGLLLLGCEGSVSLIPNADPALRKPPVRFAADAAKRQYEAGAPKVPSSDFRADYALVLQEVDLANVSNRDWSNVEVWINGKFVVFCENFQPKTDKALNFTMFYDGQGNHFTTANGKNPVQSIEIYRDGTMYSVYHRVADGA